MVTQEPPSDDLLFLSPVEKFCLAAYFLGHITTVALTLEFPSYRDLLHKARPPRQHGLVTAGYHPGANPNLASPIYTARN